MATATTSSSFNVLHDILKWSDALPTWQRDALRRIVEIGDLTPADIDQVTAICRHDKGLTQEPLPVARPLSGADIPKGASVGQAVGLLSIADVENVNALGEKQELNFGPNGLSVIFGYNGSGKSGYGRILRRACRSRHRGPEIQPNVLRPASSSPATAVITVLLDGKEQPPEQWIDEKRAVEALGSVSFFDSSCAAVHVREKNGIAFTPFGLDVLPKLGAACVEVQKRLDAERKRLEAIRPKFLQLATASSATAVGKALSALKHDSDFKQLEVLAALGDGERERLKTLPGILANDPKRQAMELRTRVRRIQGLRETVLRANASLSDDAIASIRSLASTYAAKAKASEAAAKVSFADEPLNDIGEAAWQELWKAAKKYSQAALPGESFPPVGDGAVCVLCQQPLSDAAKDRLSRFERFVSDTTAQEAANAKAALQQAVMELDALELRDASLSEQIAEVGAVDVTLATRVRSRIAVLLLRYRAIRHAFATGSWSFAAPSIAADSVDELMKMADGLAARAKELEATSDDGGRKKLESELTELKAREWLATVLGDVKEHLRRLGELEKLRQCVEETKTNRITAKSKALATEHVTDHLRDAFASEIGKMRNGLRRFNVELVAAPGEYGSTFYRVQLVGAHKAEIHAIVSEGEHQCIALAAFLSELATEQARSAIVFDDPVTSLDHQWRECFAQRLAEEALRRQVIIFTHDVVFLHDLLDRANAIGTTVTLRRISANREHCGFVSDTLPWIAQKTLDRIDELEKQARASRADYDAGDDDQYERTISHLYSDLRATVERAVEECLFSNVVLRHRDYISLGNLAKMTAVTLVDCERVQKLFKRCCDVTEAHDRAMLRGPILPTPDDALRDMGELKSLFNEIRTRQKSVK